eukprot:gnl/TRDRNA2_/TRDRNA2_176736_c0_seq1.p1 gnl/TRDRNA2_/TRDRNA2_176736_c0~~gnl/TRDRNA2_/TRDRNA2_176736_c0_seq1.p1  ORF type:complete len:595 (-),score=151.40 gnl/TRDRNA2_/TRDRNA2_176736_c0_seq1:443-2158(-)
MAPVQMPAPVCFVDGNEQALPKKTSPVRSFLLKLGALALGLALAAVLVYENDAFLSNAAAGSAPSLRRLKTNLYANFEAEVEKAKLEQRVAHSVKAAMNGIEAVQKKTQEDTDHGVETNMDLSLSKSQARLAQWRLKSSEVILEQAAHDAIIEYEDCDGDAEKARVPDWSLRAKNRHIAARKAVYALTNWGAFEDKHGHSKEAIESLDSAVELAKTIAPTGEGNKATSQDLSLLARAKSALGTALCNRGGSEGRSFVEAQERFQEALAATAEAKAASKDELAGAPLEAEVLLDFAECLYYEADVPAAHTQADAALTAVRTVKDGPVKKQLSQRLVKIRAMVLHDEGAAESAARLYSEYLEATGKGGQQDPDSTVDYFHIMQNDIIRLEGAGKIKEASAKLDELKRLQAAADKQVHEKTDAKFLMPEGALDIGLWSTMARTKMIQAQLFLAQSGSENLLLANGAQDVEDIHEGKKKHSEKSQKALRKQALAQAQEAVKMLRKDGYRRDLIDAVTTLGLVHMELKHNKKSDCLDEGGAGTRTGGAPRQQCLHRDGQLQHSLRPRAVRRPRRGT